MLARKLTLPSQPKHSTALPGLHPPAFASETRVARVPSTVGVSVALADDGVSNVSRAYSELARKQMDDENDSQ